MSFRQKFLNLLRKNKKLFAYARNIKKIMQANRKKLSLILGSSPKDAPSFFCIGRGIEIGPDYTPYPFLSNVEVADFLNDERKLGFDLPGIVPLIPPKCLLSNVKDSKYDFVYAAHVLEHSFNPFRTIEEWVRVTRDLGIIYIVVPNKFKTYDRFRENSSIEYLVRKYEDDAWDFSKIEIKNMIKNSLPAHDCPIWYKSDNDTLDEIVSKIYDHPDGRDHYSVFDMKSFISLVELAEKMFNLELIYFQNINIEFHAVFKKLNKENVS